MRPLPSDTFPIARGQRIAHEGDADFVVAVALGTDTRGAEGGNDCDDGDAR
jgi:hypothetical protein